MNSATSEPWSLQKLKPESQNSRYAFPATIAAVAVAFFAVILAMTFPSAGHSGTDGFGPTFTNPFSSTNELKKFSSYQEMSDFLSKVQAFLAAHQGNNNANNGAMRLGPALGSGSAMYGPSATPEYSAGGQTSGYAPSTEDQSSLEATKGRDVLYSSTNVQEEGVDESDFLKNDGKYAYILSGNMLSIVDAYPPESAKLLARVSLDIPEGQYSQNMFLNGDRLVIFYQSYSNVPTVQAETSGNYYSYPPERISEPVTHVLVIDISDRASPRTLRNYDVLGQYSSSRMIGDRVFLLTVIAVDSSKPVEPSVYESSSRLIINPDVYYFDYPQQSYAFNTITALNLDQIRATPSKDDKDGEGATDGLVSRSFMVGAGSTIYVSDRNIYIASSENPWPIPIMQQDGGGAPTASRDLIASTTIQSTVIHKISIAPDSLFDYGGKTQVPGTLLNQFSMDESGDRFTVATTSESQSFRGFSMENNVYRFDTSMKMVGKLEGISEGESIYAARFMGDRLYLVTFRQTDPFFVIDLSHDDPKLLGKLKLPGYSNYLHPYDDSHMIGIGREGPESGSQGVKLALFDVSDLDNPRVIDSYVIGGSQTDSEVLRDHKALLFSKEKDLLSIPVYSYDGYYYREDSGKSIDPLSKITGPWNGFYIFGLTPKEGFELKGTVQHDANIDGIDMSQGSRSFFIIDALYTVTPGLLKITDLSDVEHELNHIELRGSGDIIRPLS